jgi:hypothetical protein
MEMPKLPFVAVVGDCNARLREAVHQDEVPGRDGAGELDVDELRLAVRRGAGVEALDDGAELRLLGGVRVGDGAAADDASIVIL